MRAFVAPPPSIVVEVLQFMSIPRAIDLPHASLHLHAVRRNFDHRA